MEKSPLEFRAWHTPTQTLFPVLYFTDNEVVRTPYHAYWRDECILMQFTGLYDCAGTKIFEGDVLYSYYEAHGRDTAMEYWRLVAFRPGGFCEVRTPEEEIDPLETVWLSQYRAVAYGGFLPDKIVDCLYVRPYLLDLNTESAEVPHSFDRAEIPVCAQ